MKKILIILIAISLIGLSLFANYTETHYNRSATVSEISGNSIIVVDSCGYEWEFFGENYIVGEKLKLKMFTNCTTQITDDEILEVEKEGN